MNDDAVAERVQRWWRTSIIDMRPGEIRLRGYAIEDLIGRVSFAQTVWLMLRGELPSAAQACLLEAALVAAVDHGPQAPSIAIARMAITACRIARLEVRGLKFSAVSSLFVAAGALNSPEVAVAVPQGSFG
jgi:citrate synthase